MAIINPSPAGSFSVTMKPGFTAEENNTSTTVDLNGVEGKLASCLIVQEKVDYTFNPATLVFLFDEISTAKSVKVGTTNAGDISYGLSARSSESWCHVSVNGGNLVITVDAHYGTNSSRKTTIYVTYLNSEGTFNVIQRSEGPMTVTIGNLQWCEYNLADPFSQYDETKVGSFASLKPSECPDGIREESHGKFYQWNRPVAWASTGYSVTNWNTSVPGGATWTEANNPCPPGFRPPEYVNIKLFSALVRYLI